MSADLYQLPRRKYCYYCGKYIFNDNIFICSKCGLSFCEDHRKPEAHECKGYEQEKVLPPGITEEDLRRMCEWCGKISSLKECRYCGGRFCEEHSLPHDHCCENYVPEKIVVDRGTVSYVRIGGYKVPPAKRGREKPKIRVEKVDTTEDEKFDELFEACPPSSTSSTQVSELSYPKLTVRPVEEFPHQENISHRKISAKAVGAIAAILVIAVLFLGFKYGYLPSPNFETGNTPQLSNPQAVVVNPTPNIAEKVIVSLENYYFIASHEASGIGLTLKFENKNSAPVRVTVISGKTASGIELFNANRELKEPLDEFTIASNGAVSKKYFIPGAKLEKITGDKLSIELEITSSKVTQTKDVVVWF
ncbi:AN1-type zinc finger protein [Archaeoglobus veneficus]|uniref:AN1-type domain-containing protein n=1 Tax=Archaeoglobus veneficus (strain DSM 11195 / SNP6) TaxID=693661 RepID=F2KSX6_ARCVS|nr:AN1-type zinc finger domain-containing protein [Archaeoglobus veneficus]AEA48120.1 hypothetical protein Arcve_2131 [Archaeoglobus veneficus SNP6]